MRAPSDIVRVLWLFSVALAAGAPPLLDPNAAEFPDSSLVDFGRFAAERSRGDGFLTVDGAGHFVWPDGRRARFWGINVAAESVFQPTDRIDECVERIRRAGFNLVRIHHVDGTARGIIAGGAESTAFDPARLRLLDYWIDRLGRAGIAVFLDLLDYREFLPGDGVPNARRLGRGAKPFALFDERLITLQQRYAKALLRDHVNVFNGRAYADDPTVAMVELFDENGLFIRRGDWPTLAEPYRSDLTRRWNEFLLARYGSTAGLTRAWSASGVDWPLPPGAALEAGTVPLPELTLVPDTPPDSAAERLRRAMAADAARFAAEVHRAYYRRMRDFLRREVGLRVPLGAVGDSGIVPDLLAVSGELDFTGTNYYWDHPIFRAGRAWRSPFLFHYRSPLASTDAEAFAAKVALARIAGTPVVVREWNHCFPNPHRAAGMVEACVYAALQDVDAMILFTYGAVPSGRMIGYFDVHQDPARWGLAAMLGEVFLSRAVAPARRTVEIGYSDVDTFLFKDYRSALRELAWVSRVANRCFGEDLEASADLTVASGRSGGARYRGGPLLICRNDPTVATTGAVSPQAPDTLGLPVPLGQGPSGSYRFDGALIWPAGTQRRAAGGRFRLTDITASGFQPYGAGATDAVGFRDAQGRVYAFGPLTPGEQLRGALDLLKLLYAAPEGRAQAETKRYRSDTGELVRDSGAGRLAVNSPRCAAVAGNLAGGSYRLGGLRIEVGAERGVVMVLSLGGPLTATRRLVARMVGDAVNTGMNVTPPGPQSNPRDLYEVSGLGGPPVRSNGRRTSQGWRVYRGDELLFAVDLAGGTAEVCLDEGEWRWFVDTPGTTVRVAGAKTAVAVDRQGRERTLPGGPPWSFPADAAVVVAR